MWYLTIRLPSFAQCKGIDYSGPVHFPHTGAARRSARCWPSWRGVSASSWTTTPITSVSIFPRIVEWLPSGSSARRRLPAANRKPGRFTTRTPRRWTRRDLVDANPMYRRRRCGVSRFDLQDSCRFQVPSGLPPIESLRLPRANRRFTMDGSDDRARIGGGVAGPSHWIGCGGPTDRNRSLSDWPDVGRFRRSINADPRRPVQTC